MKNSDTTKENIIDIIENETIADAQLTEQRKMSEHLFNQRERLFHHASFERETAFYESVCSGNLEKVRMLSTPLCSAGYGILSNDPLQNLKYHFVVSVAMLTRYCITAGLPPEEAYNMSDVYIMRADSYTTESAVHKLHEEMLSGYTKRMRSIANSKVYSKPIIKAIDYISEHLHQHLSLHETADHLGLSKAYLSRLFKDETGVVFNEYVRIKKVEAASDMIRFSKLSFLEISNLLCFSSQSYFIKVFREYTGMTPKEYRNRYHLSLK